MIRFTVIGGYLGTGKTTLLNRILASNTGTRYALLINDFGEINIDAELIESQTDSQINLTNGCVCCTLVDGFHDAIEQLSEQDPAPDHIIVEASGVADVHNLSQYGHGPNLELDGILVVADAETVHLKANDKYVATTVRRQLAAADIILLNKTDLLTPEKLEQQKQWLQTTAPDVSIVETSFCDAPLSVLLGVHHDRAHDDSGHTDHESYGTWKFESYRSTTQSAMQDFIDHLPAAVIRAKGIVQQENGKNLLVQVVGKRQEITPSKNTGTGIKLIAIGLAGQLDRDVLDELARQAFATD